MISHSLISPTLGTVILTLLDMVTVLLILRIMGKTRVFGRQPRENEHVGIYQYQEYETTWRVATQQGIKELTSEEYAKSRGELDAQGLERNQAAEDGHAPSHWH